MPKWLIKPIVYLVMVIFGVGVVLIGIFLVANSINGGSNPANPGGNYPTLDATQMTEYTPSYQANDVNNFVATIMPTPRAFITEPEVNSMNLALQDKHQFLAADSLTGASFQAMNVSWYCTRLKFLAWDLPASDIGAAKLIEGEWDMATNLSDITFSVEKGSQAAPVSGNDSNGAPTIETKYNGILVVTISSFSTTGPTILRGNQHVFGVGKPLTGYQILLGPGELITGVNVISENEKLVTNMAEELVNYETIVPDGSDANLMKMYSDFQSSFTTPGDKHIYKTLLTALEPMAEKYGFAGIESIRVVMPSAPLTIYGWLDKTGTPLIPADYPSKFAGSTCPTPKPTQADINQLFDTGK